MPCCSFVVSRIERKGDCYPFESDVDFTLQTDPACPSYTKGAPPPPKSKNEKTSPPALTSNAVCLSLVVLTGSGVAVGSAILSLETDGLVNDQVTGDGVASRADGEADDDTKGNQLGGDVLKASEALGDSVGRLLLLRNGPHHAGGGPEHPQRARSKHFEMTEWGCSSRG